MEIARVNRAKALLETSDWPLGRVAERSGFGSVEGLHRAFNKQVRVTPGEYRKRFGHVAQTAKPALDASALAAQEEIEPVNLRL